ncbi:MAG TPA: hypothetical protein VFE47_19950 [Tepidisphaeraceae bacterium]|jgi:hypothetical protein|nr:hypothetical protein [Tepidisphaeraceae bacterium]
MTETIVANTTARLIARSTLTEADLAGMHQLLSHHFDGVTRGQFEADLMEKNWVILIERGDEVVGFTTILTYETTFSGGPVSVVYSGDTIVSPSAWNSSSLPRAWIESVASLRKLHPRGPYVWLLITSGFRTYRFLPVFWREFFPRYDMPTPAHWKAMMDHIAMERFGSQYDPQSGIVRLKNPQRLAESLAVVPQGRLDDPHIAFFTARNPGHADGDELVCLADLSPVQLTPAGQRMAAATPQW